MIIRTSLFKPPSIVKYQYTGNDIRVYAYESREPKTVCVVDCGLLVPTSKIKNNMHMGIGIGVVPTTSSFHMHRHKDQHKMWAHPLAMDISTQFSFNLAAF